MATDVVIRLARPEDIETMVKLVSLIFSVEEDFSIDVEKQQRGLEMFFAYPSGRCLLVAEFQGNVIGMCSAQLLVSTAEGGWKGLVEDVVVAERFRGLGIGKRMLSALEEWAREQSAKRMDLLADRCNTNALEFYDRLEWKKTNLIALQKKV